jgi:hypothetical protein
LYAGVGIPALFRTFSTVARRIAAVDRCAPSSTRRRIDRSGTVPSSKAKVVSPNLHVRSFLAGTRNADSKKRHTLAGESHVVDSWTAPSKVSSGFGGVPLSLRLGPSLFASILGGVRRVAWRLGAIRSARERPAHCRRNRFSPRSMRLIRSRQGM